MPDVYPLLANGHPALPYKHPPMPYVHPTMADRNFHETNNHLMPTGRTQETNIKLSKQTPNAYFKLSYTKLQNNKIVKISFL
jgi:hypothetical protein